MPTYHHMLLKKYLPGEDGKPAILRLCLVPVPRPPPEPEQVVIRVGGAPINPSDLGGLGGDRLDLCIESSGGSELPQVDVPLPDHVHLEQESDWSFAGNEGAGVIEEAGSSAQHLLGKTVFFHGASYSEFSVRHMSEVQVQPEGVTAKQAASSFVNPMTVLGMLEKARREGHTALVHTAAASQLGQMLIRACQADGFGLVNIVRRPQQAALLRTVVGASHVVDSSSEDFREELTDALAETGATIAFDALGGGSLVSTIIECMEAAAWKRGDTGSAYGSSVWKQVYTYGRLEPAPLTLSLDFGGYRWNLGGYLVSDFLETVSEEWRAAARERIARELETTFRTDYTKEVSLRELLTPENLQLANKKGTGQKLLVVP